MNQVNLVIVPEESQETRKEKSGNKEGKGRSPCHGSLIDHLDHERGILKCLWPSNTIMSINDHSVTTRRNIVQGDEVGCIPSTGNRWNVSRSHPLILVNLPWINGFVSRFNVICIWNKWTWNESERQTLGKELQNEEEEGCKEWNGLEFRFGFWTAKKGGSEPIEERKERKGGEERIHALIRLFIVFNVLCLCNEMYFVFKGWKKWEQQLLLVNESEKKYWTDSRCLSLFIRLRGCFGDGWMTEWMCRETGIRGQKEAIQEGIEDGIERERERDGERDKRLKVHWVHAAG